MEQGRIASTVKDHVDANDRFVKIVVDGKGKSLHHQSPAEMYEKSGVPFITGTQAENGFVQMLEGLQSQARSLRFIELIATEQVVLCITENEQPHPTTFEKIRWRASSQFVNEASPAAMR